MNPHVIFLDAVGTLFGLRQSVGEVYCHFAAKSGVYVEATQLNQAFIASFRTAPRCAFPGASPQALPQLEYNWWKDVAANSFATVDALARFPDFDQFFQPLFAYYETADPWYLYADVLPALNHWHRKGITLAVISNFDSRLYQLLRVLGLGEFFSSLTLSSQVGAAKPDVAIFHRALAAYPISPEQACHIGDSWSEDVQGAIASGIHPIWLHRENALFQDQPIDDTDSVPTISSLTDLVET